MNTELNPTKERFSFREMEHIAVNYAITCQKGYTGTFRDYMKGINKDWRKWLKERDKDEIKQVHTEYRYIPVSDATKKFYKNYVSNGCDCLQMSCPICHG